MSYTTLNRIFVSYTAKKMIFFELYGNEKDICELQIMYNIEKDICELYGIKKDICELVGHIKVYL